MLPGTTGRHLREFGERRLPACIRWQLADGSSFRRRLRPTPLIKTGLAGWSGFPAAMDPNPLPGIGANEFFDRGRVERGGIDDVFLGVVSGSDGFDEFTNQNAIAVCIPHAARRNDERVGAQGQHGDGAGGAGKMTEEGDKDAVALQCIYVGSWPIHTPFATSATTVQPTEQCVQMFL